MLRGLVRGAVTLLLVALALVVVACGSGQATGVVQLVVADQTNENPIKDVIEISIGGGTAIYPGSASGGTPTVVGEWKAGEAVGLILWANANEESIIQTSIPIPSDLDVDLLSLVLEIEDNQVLLRSAALDFTETYERRNPAQEQRQAEARAAEEAAQAAEDDARKAEEEAQAHARDVRREATRLETEMGAMLRKLNVVLDEHNKVYGDDGWANFDEIERKYRDYTSEALEELRTELTELSFQTGEVIREHSEWQSWWQKYFALQARAEVAARNNDSASMDAVRADEDRLWEDWSALSDRADELARASADDL